MASTIKLKNGSGAPLAADLVTAEPALDLTNKRLYTEDSLGNVIEVGTNPTSLTTGDITTTGAVDVTGDLDVDNINIDGNAITSTDTNGNIAITPNGTGEVDISKVDIDSGAIDGTTIGGTTTAAGSFTTLQADTSLNVDGTVTADGLTVDTDTLYVDATNNRVGIGTTSPAASLTVEAGGEPTIRLNKTALGVTADFKIESNKAILRTTTSDPLILKTNNIDRLRASANGDINFYDTAGSTAGFHWDAADESLGIGTQSPNSKLTVSGDKYVLTNSGQSDGIRLYSSTAPANGDYTQAVSFGYTSGSSAIAGLRDGADSDQMGLAFIVHGSTTGSADATEAMRITSGGSLLVGKTTSGGTTAGMAWLGNEYLQLVNTETGATDRCLLINRQSSEGVAIEIREANAAAGVIGTKNDDLYIGTGDTGIRFADSVNSVYPHNTSTNAAVDATISLGANGFRFNTIHLSNGVSFDENPSLVTGSVTNKTLDDYEEGTFTIGVTCGGTAESASNVYTQYTKVGNKVTVNARFSVASFSGTGGVSFALPYAVTSNANHYLIVPIGGNRLSHPGDTPAVSLVPSATSASLVGIINSTASSAASITEANFSASTQVRASFTYFTD